MRALGVRLPRSFRAWRRLATFAALLAVLGLAVPDAGHPVLGRGVCAVDGCDRSPTGNRLCSSHQKRWIDGGRPELADFLEKRALDGRENCFIIGGPEGLPQEVSDQSDFQWGLARLTFPHDLAMVVLLEALYRASTIAAGQPMTRPPT